MNKQAEALNVNWPDKAQFYLQGMSMENSLLQSYRMIFGAIEAVLFAAWFGVPWNETIELGKLLVAIFGILACVGWIIVCRDRGAEVSAWRDKVKEAVKGTEAENFIQQRFQPEPGAKFFWQVMSARIWLSLILPGILIILWSILLSSCFCVGLGVLFFLPVLLLVLRKMFNIDLLQLQIKMK